MASRTSVHEVISEFRTASTNVERGEKFEALMVDYFRLDPTLSVEYDEVQRWPEWPHRENTHGAGIDLVAHRKDTGEWTAIRPDPHCPHCGGFRPRRRSGWESRPRRERTAPHREP